MSTQEQIKSIAQNVAIGLVAIPAYAVVSKNNRKILEESVTFGFINGLTQQFVPQLLDDPTVQKLFINPIIAGFTQAILKDFVFSTASEKALGRSIIASISAASVVNLINL